MTARRISKTSAILLFLLVVAGLFLGPKLLESISTAGPFLKPTPTTTPSNCPSDPMKAEIRISSTNIKIGDTFTVTGAINRSIGPVYFLGIDDVGQGKNEVTVYDLPHGIRIRINSRVISLETGRSELDELQPGREISIELRAEQAGSFTVTFGINGETGNDCAGYPIWNYQDINADPLTISVTEP